jgi:hypothetical protein
MAGRGTMYKRVHIWPSRPIFSMRLGVYTIRDISIKEATACGGKPLIRRAGIRFDMRVNSNMGGVVASYYYGRSRYLTGLMLRSGAPPEDDG